MTVGVQQEIKRSGSCAGSGIPECVQVRSNSVKSQVNALDVCRLLRARRGSAPNVLPTRRSVGEAGEEVQTAERRSEYEGIRERGTESTAVTIELR